MIRISAVSYLNSQPFIYGLKHQPPHDCEISLDIPSECARKLIEDETDIGLVPVAVLKQLQEYHILSDYCIGSNGPVDSVKLYSKVPLNEIKTVLLDYQSRTSVNLVKILAKELWLINPEWKQATAGYEQDIILNTAAVVIGDRTFNMNGNFPFEYDLSAEWKKLTGLPFVFAVWVSKKKPESGFNAKFCRSLDFGMQHMNEVIAEMKDHYPEADIHKYLTQSISYRLDERKKTALQLFLSKLG